MSLRVMTYNVFNGGAGRENLLREVLRAVAPDVVRLWRSLRYEVGCSRPSNT